jgi:murein DD-endopeptidase MepM/ murein hydrolase activator NlpD
MKSILHLLKVSVEIGGILLIVLLVFVAVNFFRVPNPNTVSPETGGAYPPPQNGVEQVQVTPNMQVSPYPGPDEQSTVPAFPNQNRFVGPDCVVDRSKKLSLQIPRGWYADIGASSIDIMNYNPDTLEYEHGKPKNIPADNIKIEIYELELKPNQTLEQWVSEEKAQTRGQDGNAPTVSENYPYQLGQYDGVAYAITDSTGWNSRIIALKVDTEKGIVVTVFPADSQAFSDALGILATLDASGNITCSGNTFIPEHVSDSPKELSQIKPPTLTTFECPTGVTYPGAEAKSSTIDIQMPFPWGQTWIVGGGGAFYGNYHHCNYYNNYYATDWNRPDNNDRGFTVVSIAGGTVSSVDSPPCTTERYGCYVDVDHASGFRTRYAHLENVFVSPGDSVGAGTFLGTVGQSGTNNYHLHLSFWYWDLSDYPYHYEYFGQCYNNGQTCPNGEASYCPQGYRPSPMWTTYGNAYLVDGLPFTSINGWAVFIPLVIK